MITLLFAASGSACGNIAPQVGSGVRFRKAGYFYVFRLLQINNVTCHKMSPMCV